MAHRVITVTIPRRGLVEGKGKVKVEAEGFTGNACSIATRPFIDAIGKATSVEEKDEMHKEQEPPLRIREGG